MTSLRLIPGSTVTLTDPYGVRKSFYVRERQRNGYMLEPKDIEAEGERHFHLDTAIIEYYALGRLEYKSINDNNLAAARARRLALTWEAVPPHQQRNAERREQVVKAIKKAVRSGKPIGQSMEAVPKAVIAQHAAEWATEDFAEANAKFEKEKEAGIVHEAGAGPKPRNPFAVPSARTAWEWCFRYMELHEDVRALVRYDSEKGNRNQIAPEMLQEMDAFIKKLIEDNLVGRKIAPIYKTFKKRMAAQGRTPPSVITFTKRLREKVSRYEMIAAQSGKRAADQSRDIAEFVPDPEWALAQVEIDHTLADIHLICDITGYRIGRPWITVVLDRLTRVILGCHISVLAPQWATLSRAMIHAIWMKDLNAFPMLAGRWDYHGVFDTAYTDRGMDFISHSGRRAGHFVGFEMANLLGFAPWLKGKIERCFGRLAVQCYDYQHGLTSISDPHYDPRKSANILFSEFKTDLINWIVDYNHSEHGGLPGRRSPDASWQLSTQEVGGVNPVPTVSSLRRMMGKSVYPKIGNNGMRVQGLDYVHPRMEELRERHDIVGRRFEVRFDPFNLAAIDFFDGNEWLTAYCRRPDIADGVTAWQHNFHLQIAKQRATNGVITEDLLARVKAQAQTDFDLLRHQFGKNKLRTNGSKLAQYMDTGQFLTPIQLIPQPSLAKPLEIPNGVLLEEGRYLISPTQGAAPLAISSPAKVLQRGQTTPVHTPAKSAAATVATGPSLEEQMRSRLAQSRRSRGAK